jgi:hypothetical protein
MRRRPHYGGKRSAGVRVILVLIVAVLEITLNNGCRPCPASIGLQTNTKSLSEQQKRSLDSLYQTITFDDIGGFKLDEFALNPSDPHLEHSYQQYNGRSVMIEGEMLISDSGDATVSHFALCDPSDVVRSVAPPVQRQVLVYTKAGQRVSRHDTMRVRVYGTFEVGVKNDPVLDMTTIYRLRLEHLVLLSN